jgi:hypothetical protein
LTVSKITVLFLQTFSGFIIFSLYFFWDFCQGKQIQGISPGTKEGADGKLQADLRVDQGFKTLV